MMAAVVFKRWY